MIRLIVSNQIRKENSMSYILVNHKVKDFESWKPYFDKDQNEQLKAGITINKVFRDAKDRNDVHILFEASDMEKVQKFFQNPRLKDLMHKAGVISEPVVHILELA